MSPQVTTSEKVLAVLSIAALTDREAEARLPDLHRGQVSPARNRLWRDGRVLQVGERNGHMLFRATSSPEEVEQAKAQYASRRRRPKTLVERVKDEDPEVVAKAVAEALRDPKVDAAVQVIQATGSRRARARARDARHETARQAAERRKRDEQLVRDNRALKDFIVVKDHLYRTATVLAGTRSLVVEDRARHENGEPTRIPFPQYAEVAELAHTIADDVAVLLAALGEGPPEAEAIGKGYVAEAEAELIESEVVDADVIVEDETKAASG